MPTTIVFNQGNPGEVVLENEYHGGDSDARMRDPKGLPAGIRDYPQYAEGFLIGKLSATVHIANETIPGDEIGLPGIKSVTHRSKRPEASY